ncbi:hypothetical protein D3C81_1333740 [compost metagenome]
MKTGVNPMDNASPVTINTKYTMVTGKDIKKYIKLRNTLEFVPPLRGLDCDDAGICTDSCAPIGIVYTLLFILSFLSRFSLNHHYTW